MAEYILLLFYVRVKLYDIVSFLNVDIFPEKVYTKAKKVER